MLASTADGPFDSQDWIFELKWDGYRAVADCSGKSIKLYSRNGLSFHERYPSIIERLEKMNVNAVLDGEIVLMNEKDQPDFQKLQHYEENKNLPLIYYVFDILFLDKKNLQSLPLLERKAILKKLLKKNPVIRYSDHVMENGKAFFEEVRKLNMEGIMAKKKDSTYSPGVRTREWLKIKNIQSREAIIAGYTEGRGSRKHFGALVLGEYVDGKLEYIGHTGTGFNDKTLKELWTLMQKHKQDTSPFEEKIAVNSTVTWLQPYLVCEVNYTEMTRDGILRHPVFLRLRDDKNASEVKPETPKSEQMKSKRALKKSAPAKAAAKKAASPKSSTDVVKDEKTKVLVINKHQVELSNINKIYWPDDKLTKGDMLNYYESVADYILPYMKDRPLSLNRHPNGITDKGFYHKNAGDIAPSWMSTKEVISGDGKKIDYLVCNNKESLLFVANLGCIEMNPWNSTTKKMDNPTWMVIDIDPSDDNTFEQVIETAQVVRSILERAKIKSYCKTSGSSGLHVYVPMGAKYDYEQVKGFANLIAMLVTQELPDITTLERSLSKRSSKKIYVDYLQNRRGQTLATTYSLRPKPGAPVSMPLEWKEVKKGLHPTDFNIHNALARIKKKGDIFLPVLGPGIDLKKALGELGG